MPYGILGSYRGTVFSVITESRYTGIFWNTENTGNYRYTENTASPSLAYRLPRTCSDDLTPDIV